MIANIRLQYENNTAACFTQGSKGPPNSNPLSIQVALMLKSQSKELKTSVPGVPSKFFLCYLYDLGWLTHPYYFMNFFSLD